MPTPREDGFAMPAEFAPHRRTLMGWPTRRELWGDELGQAKRDFTAVANAIAHVLGRHLHELPMTPERVWGVANEVAG